MSGAIIKHPDGTYDMLPGATVIETDDGVHYTFDVDPYSDDFTFADGASLVGHLNASRIEHITPPDGVDPDWANYFTDE